MEEERIKSALEIAMERISALPDLTAEEIAAQKEKQFGPLGEAIASRYLSGLIAEEELIAELEKYPEEQRRIVRRGLVSGLCRTLQLEGDLTSARKALKGMCRIAPEKIPLIEKAAEEYEETIHEFVRDRKKLSEEMGAAALNELGISGTAVRCNPIETAQYPEALKKLRLTYQPKLNSLYRGLTEVTQSK